MSPRSNTADRTEVIDTTAMGGDLVVIQPGQSAIAQAISDSTPIGDANEFDALDLNDDNGQPNIPLLRMNRKVGQKESGIHVNGTPHTEFDFVWAASQITRAHFAKTFDEDRAARPDCHSSNGIEPDPTSPDSKANKCATCPYSFEALGGDRADDGTPSCGKSMEVLTYFEDGLRDVSVARIRFSGLSFAAARSYLNGFKYSRPRKMPFQYRTRMILEPTETNNGTFLVPTFNRVEPIPDEPAIAIGRDAMEIKAAWQQLVEQDIVTVEASDVTDQGGPFDNPPAADPVTGEVIPPGRSNAERREPSHTFEESPF